MTIQPDSLIPAATETDLSATFTVEQTPEQVYAAILNVPTWWTGQIEGPTDEVGAEFHYRHAPQHHSRQRVIALEPGRRVAWRVVESDLSFLEDPAEWAGTTIVFDIAPVAGGTELRFTHVGVTPQVECFERCSTAWQHYIVGSLHNLVTAGAGLPDPW